MSSKKIVKLCSRIIDNCEDVPEIFRDGFNYLCLDCNNFPFSIYTYEERDNIEGYCQLISLTEESLFIFDVKNTGVRLTQYTYDDIILIRKTNGNEISTIFIEGIISGRMFQSIIEFDNSRAHIFEVLIVNIRLKGKSSEGWKKDGNLQEGYELLKLGSLKDSNPRMFNFAVETLLPNRTIKNIVLQKKLIIKKLKLIRKFITLPHVILLTEDELIIIEEGKENKKAPQLNLGGFWYFIPIDKITSIDIISSDNYFLELTINLKGNEVVKLIYENTMKYQLEQLARSAHAVYRMR